MFSKLKFVRLIAAVLAASLSVLALSAGPASAEGAKVGNAELQAAVAKSQKAMMATGMVFTPPSVSEFMTYKIVLAPKNKLVPANLGVSMSMLGISASVLYSSVEGVVIGGLGSSLSDGPVTIGSKSDSTIWPDENGLVLGKENASAVTLNEYEVTKPTADTIAIHMVTTNRIELQDGEPTVATVDSVYTIANGMVSRIETTSDASYSLIDGPQVSEFDYSAEAINFAFEAIVDSWKSTHFDASTKKLGLKLTDAFIASQKAALKSGVSITESGKGSMSDPQEGTYDPVTKKSVSVSYTDKKKAVFSVGFGDTTQAFGLIWSNLLGVNYYLKKSITYNTKTRTYSLKGTDGSTSTIKLDAKGRIISAKIAGLRVEDKTITYGPNKALLKKWSGLTTKAQALVVWLSQSYVPTRPTQVKFTLKGKTITANPSVYADVPTFDVTGMKTADITKAFKLLGLKLTK